MNRLSLAACLLALMVISDRAHAWGEKGHHLVCDEATRLVKESGLKNFLKIRGHVMGHACNVPDIHWKSLPMNVTSVGNPTHYIEPDMIGLSIRDTPTDFEAFLEKLQSAGEASQLVHKVGTLWWRVDQIFNLSLESAKQIGSQNPPTNYQEEQSNVLPYNEKVYMMMLYMGLMGHYVGDSSMPYHNWADYDGYGAGRGGIHAYYESTCPGEFGSELGVEVRNAALNLPRLRRGLSPVVLLKKLSTEAVDEVPAVERLDVVLEPSTQVVNEHGMTIRKPALRPDPVEQCPKFRPLIVLQMARSARALAYLWDQIYAQAGQPNLAPYKSYRYPLTPDFVVPSYLPGLAGPARP